MPKGAVRLTSQNISTHLTAIFYAVTKERQSVRAALRLCFNVLRFESEVSSLVATWGGSEEAIAAA